ncbi:MAG: 4-demethylwyosine synthase TYW1 [Crenarchaeota archaeon]|nr:4-demethylwyosine synthase TYW1 [Thermoproteota archaeon]
MPQQLIKVFEKQKYHIIGKHSAIKRCGWLYRTLVQNRPCYKEKFYGINTHQCIQMSPAAFYCTQQCLFCWRAQNGDLNIKFDELKFPEWDAPEDIANGIIVEQQKLLGGYRGNPKTIPQKLREAYRPRHVAISLTGEPTLYEPLGELISVLHSKNFTTFLVTNGTVPERLSKLSQEPTQMYVSVCAPNEKVYKQVCRPQISDAWDKLNMSLSSLSSFNCRTVIRMTLVKGYNMQDIEGYAKLVEKANPDYIETKAYMHVGFSTLRLSFDNMPTHKEVNEFAKQLANRTGYTIVDEASDSRVVLLSKKGKPVRFSV